MKNEMAGNKNFYLISSKNDNTKNELGFSSAFASIEKKLSHELISEINDSELTFEFNLFKVALRKDGFDKSKDLSNLTEVWYDYQPNNLAWPLMSLKLKSIIDESLTGLEHIKWIKAKINFQDEQREYFVPKFTKKLDVLDVAKTMFVPNTDHIIKPTYSFEKVKDLAMFHKPSTLWQITHSIYVKESLKNAIQKHKIKDIAFDKTLVL